MKQLSSHGEGGDILGKFYRLRGYETFFPDPVVDVR